MHALDRFLSPTAVHLLPRIMANDNLLIKWTVIWLQMHIAHDRLHEHTISVCSWLEGNSQQITIIHRHYSGNARTNYIIHTHANDHFLFVGQCKFLFIACIISSIQHTIGHTSSLHACTQIWRTDLLPKRTLSWCIAFLSFSRFRHGYMEFGHLFHVTLLIISCHKQIY